MLNIKFRQKTNIIALIVLIIYFITVLIPFFFGFVTSLKSRKDIHATPIEYLPKNASFDQYYHVLFETNYGKYMINSLIIAGSTTIICLILGTLAGYGLARFKFRFSPVLLLSMVAVRLIPPISLLIPIFLFVKYLNGLDTLWSLVITNSMFNVPFFIWIAWGFFKEFSWSMEEAALCDGCTNFGAFLKITLPLTAPGIASAAIVAFMFTWNEYLYGMILTQTATSKPITVGISDFVADAFVPWNQITAAALLGTIPAIIFVLVFQKYLVRGLTSGGIKG